MSADYSEIERKYVVRPPRPGYLTGRRSRRYQQGYIVIGDIEVRIRRDDRQDSYRLAIKSGLGFVRTEVEVHVDERDGKALWDMSDPYRVEKTRYELPNEWVLDELHGRHTGLWVLEIEVPHETSTIPPFPLGLRIVDDVTEDPRYKTQNLAAFGLPTPPTMAAAGL